MKMIINHNNIERVVFSCGLDWNDQTLEELRSYLDRFEGKMQLVFDTKSKSIVVVPL
jgi:UDP-N-acetylmuramoylalanine-D-glutamate ligase